MLLAEKRKRQEVAGKIGHGEYAYRLNGEAQQHEQQIRVRAQGDWQVGDQPQRAAPSRRPPFAVDDAAYEAKNNRRDGNGGAAQAGGGPNGQSPALQSPAPYYPGGDGGGWRAPPSRGGPSYPSASPPAPGVFYTPTLPQLAVSSDPPPGPLPHVYQPKPPLTFHAGGGYPPSRQSPQSLLAPMPFPVFAPDPVHQPILMSPVKPRGDGRTEMARPYTSPALPGSGGDLAPTPQRRQSAGAAGLLPGLGGLSEQDARQREKQDARRRAQALQEENARQAFERERQKAEAKAREDAEARAEDARLRKEREDVARRERAEVAKEEEERQLKMMGPKAAAAYREQKQQEERAQAAKAEKEKPPEKNELTVAPVPSASPALTQPPALPQLTTVPADSAQILARPPPQTASLWSTPPPVQPYGYALAARPDAGGPLYGPLRPAAAPSGAPLYTYETETMKSDIRRIAAHQQLIEEALVNQARQPPRGQLLVGGYERLGERPAVGAGTYLTADAPTPLTALSNGPLGPHGPLLTPLAASAMNPQPVGRSPVAASYGLSRPLLPIGSSRDAAPLPPPPPQPSLLGTTAYPPVPQLPSAQPTQGIAVLASQVHSWAGRSSADGLPPRDPEDLSVEPSKFVGRVVPPPPPSPPSAGAPAKAPLSLPTPLTAPPVTRIALSASLPPPLPPPGLSAGSAAAPAEERRPSAEWKPWAVPRAETVAQESSQSGLEAAPSSRSATVGPSSLPSADRKLIATEEIHPLVNRRGGSGQSTPVSGSPFTGSSQTSESASRTSPPAAAAAAPADKPPRWLDM